MQKHPKTAVGLVRVNMDRLSKHGWTISNDGSKEQFALINSLWSKLIVENPSAFFEDQQKTTTMAVNQFGKILQKVIINRHAITCLASSPFEDGEIFELVGKEEQWIELETIRTPVPQVPEDQLLEVDDMLDAIVEDSERKGSI